MTAHILTLMIVTSYSEQIWKKEKTPEHNTLLLLIILII